KRDGKAMLYFPLIGYGNGEVNRQLSMIRQKDAGRSLADTGAHCGVLSDVSIPTYWLSYFTRERDRGERVPVEEAVKLHTHDTARCVGLEDRGTLELGMKADINVIDYENLRMLAPEVRYDLPAGGRRIFQGAEGYKYTIVSGEVIMRDGVETEAMPGKLIRGTQKPSQAGAAG
ncbi:MAG: amidohydrolase family protein, partial [Pseudomonadales bacterium]